MERENTIYRIYELQSPSGRRYVGLTKTSIWQRWRGHVKRARTGVNHPLYNAIRKYGGDAFVITHIACAVGRSAAQHVERACIAQVPPRSSYNISPGGEADGEVAAKVFWDRMRADPVAMEKYREKLILAQQRRPPITEAQAAYVKAQGRAWRRENPRDAWKNSYRASRVAAPNGNKKPPDSRTLKEKLLAKHKGVFPRRAAGAASVWASRSEAEVASIGAKIARALKARHANDSSFAESNNAKLAKARANVDREWQAARASAGQKAYWAALKADPARYAEYIGRRVATLAKTNKAKKDAKENV